MTANRKSSMALIYSGLFAAALVSLVLTVVAVFFLGKRGPWGSVWTFFLVLFLVLSTLSIYMAPIGPVYWGVAWIPISIAGVLLMILLIAAMPHEERRDADSTADTPGVTASGSPTATPVGRFFWLLIILIVIAIVVGMMNPQTAL